MKTQLIGWFFFVLFCSSIAHDWRRGIRNIQKRAVEGNETEKNAATANNPVQYYCSPNNPGVFAIINNTIQVAIIFDINTGDACLMNGNNGIAVYINSSGACYYVTNGWKAATIAFDIYIATIKLSAFITLSTTKSVDVSKPSSEVLILCQLVLGSLDSGLSDKVKTNINISLSTAISLCTEICISLKVQLLGLIKLSAGVYVDIKVGLMGFIEILRGLISLCVTANFEPSKIVAAGVILELKALLEADNGISCFVYVAGLIGAKFNLVTCFNVVITNIQIFLDICVRLGGNSYAGVNGVFRVVAACYAFTSGKMNMDNVLLIILNVCANINGVISITAAVNGLLDLLKVQVSLWNNATGLANIKLFIDLIVAGKCSIAKIDISLCISKLCGGVTTTVLDLVIDIVIGLTVYVTANITVSLYYTTLLRDILFLLKDASGCKLINMLIPGLNVPINYGSLNLLSGLTITIVQVLLTLKVSGLVPAILSVKTLANIYIPFNNIIKAKTGSPLDAFMQDNSCKPEINLISTFMNTIDHCGSS